MNGESETAVVLNGFRERERRKREGGGEQRQGQSLDANL